MLKRLWLSVGFFHILSATGWQEGRLVRDIKIAAASPARTIPEATLEQAFMPIYQAIGTPFEAFREWTNAMFI